MPRSGLIPLTHEATSQFLYFLSEHSKAVVTLLHIQLVYHQRPSGVSTTLCPHVHHLVQTPQRSSSGLLQQPPNDPLPPDLSLFSSVICSQEWSLWNANQIGTSLFKILWWSPIALRIKLKLLNVASKASAPWPVPFILQFPPSPHPFFYTPSSISSLSIPQTQGAHSCFRNFDFSGMFSPVLYPLPPLPGKFLLLFVSKSRLTPPVWVSGFSWAPEYPSSFTVMITLYCKGLFPCTNSYPSPGCKCPRSRTMFPLFPTIAPTTKQIYCS